MSQNAYQQWLDHPAVDAATKAKLQAMRSNPSLVDDCFYRKLEFGTAGMRGIIGPGTNRMNIYTVRQAAAGLGSFLGAQYSREEGSSVSVAIAFDNRHCSQLFAQETAKVLCGFGIGVYLYPQLRPVPMLSFAVRELQCVAGVMITASHNPKEYNGYKVYGSDGGQCEPEEASCIIHEMEAYEDFESIPLMPLDAAENAGLLRYLGADMDEKYLSKVQTLCLNKHAFENVPEMKVVYTPLHGSGNMPVRESLKRAGMRLLVVEAQADTDPDFSTVASPNPENPNALTMAMELAQTENASLCIGTDPDCDRVGVAVRRKDGSFFTLTGNMIGCILLFYVLETRKANGTLPTNGAVVKSIVSTEMAVEIARSFGVEAFDVLTGFKFIAGKIAEFERTGEYTYLFGFEESFGYLAGAFVRDKDAVQASLLLCEAAAVYAARGMTLEDAMHELYARYGWYEDEVDTLALDGREGMEKMANIMARFRQMPPKSLGEKRVVTTKDYLKGAGKNADGAPFAIDLPPSDVLLFEIEGGNKFVVRPSGTEPKVKFYYGAKGQSSAQAKSMVKAMKEDIRIALLDEEF